jgi:hypothetical protein
MNHYVLVTVDSDERDTLESCLKHNPYTINEFDPVLDTVTYKIHCTSLEEAFHLGNEFGEKYKTESDTQPIKKARKSK